MPVWDTGYEADPDNLDLLSEGDDRIRELKTDVRQRADTEHDWGDGFVVGYDDSGRHTLGSAKPFYQAAAPATMPELDFQGSNALDLGRMWIDYDAPYKLYIYDDGVLSTAAPGWRPPTLYHTPVDFQTSGRIQNLLAAGTFGAGTGTPVEDDPLNAGNEWDVLDDVGAGGDFILDLALPDVNAQVTYGLEVMVRVPMIQPSGQERWSWALTGQVDQIGGGTESVIDSYYDDVDMNSTRIGGPRFHHYSTFTQALTTAEVYRVRVRAKNDTNTGRAVHIAPPVNTIRPQQDIGMSAMMYARILTL
jgi:hypothetical protein